MIACFSSLCGKGIWDGKKREVTHYTQDSDGGFSATSSRGSRLASGRSKPCEKPKVVTSGLDDFLETKGGKGLKLHTYDDALYDLKLSGTCSARSANPNAGNVVEVAKWFAKKPTSFGEYSFRCWNCESFATFCKTTTLTPRQLTREYSRIGHDQGAWRAFLRASASTVPDQSRLLHPVTFLPRALVKILFGIFGKAVEALTDDVPN